MLPFEIFTLILLASVTAALPQPQNPKLSNLTTGIADPPMTTPMVIHDESSATGFEDVLTTQSKGRPDHDPQKAHGESTVPGLETQVHVTFSRTPKVIHSENQETGFEDPKPTAPPKVIPSDIKTRALTSEEPSIILIHTEIRVSMSAFDPNNEPGQMGPKTQNPNSQGGNNNGNPSPVGGNSPTASAGSPGGPAPANPQPTSGDDLLNLIVSKIGSPQPGAQPSSQPASPTGDSPAPNGNQPTVPGFQNPEQAQPTSPGQVATPGVPITAPGVQPTAPALTLDQSITLGPATLTLTNGLSTTVGTGSTATFVALTTNSAGQTIIVISSSGTMVSATVTSGPRTASTLKTGIEASATAAASPGGNGTPTGPGGTAATTSKKGGATRRWRWEAEWWLVIVVGILGVGIMV